MNDLVGAIDEIAPTTLEGVNQRVTDLATIVEQETTIMYGIMEDAQDDRISPEGLVNFSAYDIRVQSADHRDRGISKLFGIQTNKRTGRHMTRKRPGIQPMHPGEAGSQFPRMVYVVEGFTMYWQSPKARDAKNPELAISQLQERVSEDLCSLQGNALTWWNSHVKTTTHEAAHAMPWRTLKKMMTDKYCPRGEIKKLEFEMWNLKREGNDVKSFYTGEIYIKYNLIDN
ncbi:putative reverse transcriptase domain-containing protein [Tanacetum coccineum]